MRSHLPVLINGIIGRRPVRASSLYVTAPVCESAQNKLLNQGCTDALSCLDREVPKHGPPRCDPIWGSKSSRERMRPGPRPSWNNWAGTFRCRLSQ